MYIYIYILEMLYIYTYAIRDGVRTPEATKVPILLNNDCEGNECRNNDIGGDKEGPTCIDTKSEDVPKDCISKDIERPQNVGSNIIEISDDDTWEEKTLEEVACCDNGPVRTNRCKELNLVTSDLFCVNSNLNRGFNIYHVMSTGPYTDVIYYNYSKGLCEGLPICTKTHTVCKHFDGTETEFNGQLHTHYILAIYTDQGARSSEAESLNIRRNYLKSKRYTCHGCNNITKQRFGHHCFACKSRIKIISVNSAGHFKNLVTYCTERP
nr:uncharacterized protein LOC124816804 [Hydra vulgaris]